MTIERRKMRKYHPRRSSQVLKLQKQQLVDLQRKITMDIGSLLVLIEGGVQGEIGPAQQKAKSEFLKYGSELRKIAQELGGRFPKAVEEFLKSVDDIVHSTNHLIDEATVKEYYDSTIKLEKVVGF